MGIMGVRVLIVDDEPAIRDVLQALLDEEGYTPLVATNGAEGVACARVEQPTAILMDLMMPGMDGVSAIRQLLRDPATSDICIIAMSAGMQLRRMVSVVEVDGLLPKPFDLDVVIAELERCLRQRHLP
jgi:CheY-like chemotaxis protein